MKSFFSLKDRAAIVTGALGLLGRQHCHALAEAGANVLVTDLDAGGCSQLAEELTAQHFVRSLGCGLDITSPESLINAHRFVLDEFGRIDVLVNNAAVNDAVETRSGDVDLSSFEHFPLDLWKRSLDVNITGTFLCSQVFGTTMAQHATGSIINVASTYALVAPDQSLYVRPDGTRMMYKSPAYPTTKGAVLALTRYLAAYWGKSGVRVNALSPGGVQNNQEPFFVERYAAKTPLQRMASPTDYKGAVVFLASDASLYMTGANLIVDGGWTIW